MRTPHSSPASRCLAWWLAASAVGASAACSFTSAVPDAHEDVTSAASPIVGGVPDGDAGPGGGDGGLDAIADAVVAIVLDDGHICTGTLIAPDLVLTARHCVSNTSSLAVTCTATGKAPGGARFVGDKPPAALRIFLGRDLDPRRTPAALGKTALHAEADGPCNADLAVLVLDRRIAGARPIAVRRYGPALPGETLRAIGYGRTEKGSIGERRHRDDVRVLASGPLVSASSTALGSRELEATQSFCDGDSGGPALSRAGAVVGVASRGPACTAAAGYVYTAVSGFRSVLEEAERLTGSVVALEPGDSAQAAATAADAAVHDASEGGADAALDAPSYDRGLPARCTFAPGQRGADGTSLVFFVVLAVVVIGRRKTTVLCGLHATCAHSSERPSWLRRPRV